MNISEKDQLKIEALDLESLIDLRDYMKEVIDESNSNNKNSLANIISVDYSNEDVIKELEEKLNIIEARIRVLELDNSLDELDDFSDM